MLGTSFSLCPVKYKLYTIGCFLCSLLLSLVQVRSATAASCGRAVALLAQWNIREEL
jgi:hypothetical protein